MNMRVKRFIEKSVAVFIVLIMTVSDFLFIGESMVSYALDTVKINNSNVDFSAYFLNENGEKVEKIEREIYTKDLNLYMDISVKNEGYFNGVIKISNTNFEFVQDILGNDISSISENEIKLKQINAGTTTKIKVPIKAMNKENIALSDLDTETEVLLEGEYINSKNIQNNKNSDVKGIATVQVNWKSNINTELKLESKILTNKVYTINGEEKRIIQVLVKDQITENNYPVKNTSIEMNVPKNVESVFVNARSNDATNSMVTFSDKNYVYDNKEDKLTITVKNDDKNNISWKKECIDEFVVTYILNKNEDVYNKIINVTGMVNTYDNKNFTNTNTIQINENIDRIVSYSIKNMEKTIYKGKLYTGEERDFESVTKLNVDYINIVKNIYIKENEIQYGINDTKVPANIVYKETKINRDEFLNIFGTEGYITIKNSNGAIIGQINSTTTIDENNNLVVKYADGEKDIEIITSEPKTIGSLNIKNIYSILKTDYSREYINKFTSIYESVSVKYNEQEEVIKEKNIELKDTVSKANFEVSTNQLSAIDKNENVKIKVVLLNNDESKDLYKNPVIKINLPKQVKKVSAKYKLLYGNGLEIGNASIEEEEGRYIIKMELVGEQTLYNTESLEGTTLIIYADLEIDSLAVNSNEKITLNYTNEFATNYEDNGEKSVEVSVVSNAGIITTNNIKEYNIKTIGNQGNKKVELEVSSEEKDLTINISAINNDGAKVNNVKILGKIPNGEKSKIENLLASEIVSKNKNVKIYYSDKEDTTDDLSNKQNEWTDEVKLESAKSYLIIIDELEVGEKFEAVYRLKLPANLGYNIQTLEGYTVKYTNELTNTEKITEATTLELTTGNGPEIKTNINAFIGKDEIKDGDVVNAGEVIKYNLTIENTGNALANGVTVEALIPENSKLVEYKKIANKVNNEDINNDKDLIEGDFEEIEDEVNINNDEETFSDDEMNYVDEDDDLTETDDAISDEMVATDDYYEEINIPEGKISKNIDVIEAGEKIELSYEVRVNQDAKEGSLVNNEVNVSYSGITDTKKISNSVGKTDVGLNMYMIQRINKTLNSGDTYIYVLEVKNLAKKDISKLNVDMNFNEQFSLEEIEVFGGEDVDNTVKFENNRFTIDKIKSGETKKYMISMIANKKIGTEATLFAIANEKYRSNLITEKIKMEKVSMSIETVNSEEKVKAGDQINYNIKVINDGDTVIDELQLEQQISVCLDVEKITVDGNPVEFSKRDGGDEIEDSYTISLKHELGKGKSLDINVETITDKEILNCEDINIVSKAKAYDEVLLAETELVTNVLGAQIESVSGNQENINNDENGNVNSGNTNSDNEKNQQENNKTEENKPAENNNDKQQNNSNTQQNNVKPNDKNNTNTEINNKKNTYTISGTAWFDKNHNGQKDSEDEVLSGIKAKLINLENKTTIDTTTSENGLYEFLNVTNGQYVIIFEYDTEKYVLTTYKADGVLESKNSDVENVNMNINGKETRVSATDTLKINNNSLKYIDLGLMESKIYDFELSKTISKVIVTNKSGTQTLNYNGVTLAKTEIKPKYLQGTTVVVEYKIKVMNKGEMAGYVKNIVDYKAADFVFNSSLNPEWYQSGDYVYSSSLANTKIEAGETKELTLVLTKNMTEANTGLVNNTAEIEADFNNLGINDIDSTPGNRKKSEDDMGSADLIISVKTGAAISYVILTLSIIIVIAIGAYLISKKVLKIK